MTDTIKLPSRRTDVHIRWMIRADLPATLDIEKDAFQNPWSEDDFLNKLAERTVLASVAEAFDTVLGFYVVEIHRKHLELLNFAVSPWWRRSTIGTQMIDKLKSKLTTRRPYAEAYIRESNLDALSFFKQMGFLAVDLIPRYYSDSPDDAIVMRFEREIT